MAPHTPHACVGRSKPRPQAASSKSGGVWPILLHARISAGAKSASPLPLASLHSTHPAKPESMR